MSSKSYTKVIFNVISDRTSDIDGYLLLPSEMEELHAFLLTQNYPPKKHIIYITHDHLPHKNDAYNNK
jgi:hypothetical protein